MEAENTVADRVIGYCKPFKLALTREPRFNDVSFHVAGRVEWIDEQRPSHSAVATTHPAEFMGGLDEFVSPFRIDSECYSNQHGAILRVGFDDYLWSRPG